MKLYHYLFFVAIALAISSTFCTVTGVSQIFSANILAISIITAILESGKYGCIYTLTKRWYDDSYKKFRYILIPLVCCMTILSSAGIFSYYATSYVRSTKPISSYTVEINTLDQKIQQANQLIDRAKIQQDSINKAIDRYIELDRLRQSQELRHQNKEELDNLSNIINTQLTNIETYNTRKLELLQKVSEIKQQSGFITNIASTLKIDLTTDPDGEFKVVLIIIAIVLLAMEPLSIFSMVMGQIEYKRDNKQIPNEHKSEVNKEEIQEIKIKPSAPYYNFKDYSYNYTPQFDITRFDDKPIVQEYDDELDRNEVKVPDDMDITHVAPYPEDIFDDVNISEKEVEVDATINKERAHSVVEMK